MTVAKPKAKPPDKVSYENRTSFDYAGYPVYLPSVEHTKRCIRCERQYGNINRGFVQNNEKTTTARKYHTVCKVCQHEDVEIPNFRRAVDKQAYDREFRAAVRVAARAKVAAKKNDAGRRKKVSQIKKKDLAKAEVVRRELSRRRLINFIVRFNPQYKAGWVHKLICAKLEFFSNAVALEMAPRLLFFQPPRTGKSEIISKNFPAWHLGHHPEHEIIAASYAVSLPMGFSRKVKAMLANPAYKSMFPGVLLDPNAQATEGWYTTKGGGYVPAGVGLGITGKGAHVLIVDDPIKDMSEADSETVRNNVWDWWDSTAETRLSPGGGVVGVQCMTGDTPVMMADGSEIPLASISVGDMVATYDDGKLACAKVLNWKNQGNDRVFAIRTSSGRVIRANGKHPFLVEEAGELGWVRLKNLKLGQKIVTLKGSGESGKGKHAKKQGVIKRLGAVASAIRITTSGNGLQDTVRHQRTRQHNVRRILSTATGLLSRIMSASWKSRAGSALFANCQQRQLAAQITGANDYVLTTATIPIRSEGSCATTAISQSREGTQSRYWKPLSPTSDFTVERIVSIESDGVEDVFDIQVEHTENFIANGVTSSNTRWNDDDWSGRLLQQEMDALREIEEQRNEIVVMLDKARQKKRKSIEVDELTMRLDEVDRSVEDVVRWDVLSLPALAEHDEYATDDAQLLYKRRMGATRVRKKGEALHPERYDTSFYRRKRKSSQPRIWSALYQQNPVPDSGVYFKETMFRYEEVVPDYSQMYVYAAWDLAIGQKHTNDWTVGVIGAHDFDDRLHIINVVRVRTDELAELIVGTCEPYKRQLQKIGLEQGVIQMSVMPALNKLLEKKRWYPVFDDTLKPVTDKDARARPAQGWMQQGRVLLPRNQPWVEPFTTELLRFPGGAFDDQVDAIAWLIRMVANQAPPRRAQPKKVQKSWKDKLNSSGSVRNHQAA